MLRKTLSIFFIFFIIVLTGCQTTPSHELKSPEQQLQDQLLSGQRLLSEGKYEAALAEFHIANDLDPDNPAILMVLAHLYDKLGNEDNTVFLLRRLIAVSPNQPQALEMLGLIEIKKGERLAAKEKLTKAKELGRESWKLFNALGVLADFESNYSLARTYYARSLEQKLVNKSIVQNNIGYSYYLEGDLNKAMNNYNNVLYANPKFEQAMSNKGLLLVRQDKSKQALGVFKQYMAEEKALNTVGSLNLIFNKYKEAERYFILAIKASPNYYAEARRNLENVRGILNQNIDEYN